MSSETIRSNQKRAVPPRGGAFVGLGLPHETGRETQKRKKGDTATLIPNRSELSIQERRRRRRSSVPMAPSRAAPGSGM